MDKIGKLFELADQETKAGNYHRAIEFYKEALELSQGNKKEQHLAYWGIGEIYLNNKRYDKAKYYLTKAIELDPDEPIYQYLLGCTYTYTKEIDKAIHHLEKAVHLDDSKDIYWGQLGWVYGYNCDLDRGIKYLKKSLSINPKNTKVLSDICILYTKANKLGEALVCIEEAVKHDPDNEEISRIKQDIEFFRSEHERLWA